MFRPFACQPGESRCTSLAVALCAVLIAFNAGATQPGPVVNWLVREPPTLFDVGMSRAEALVQGALVKLRETHMEVDSAAAGFDWERNRLLLIYSAPLAHFEERWCEQLTIEVQRLLGVQTHGEPSRIAAGFGHIGFRTPNTPRNYRRRLDEIIEVQVHMQGGACRAPLMNPEVVGTQPSYWGSPDLIN